MPVMVLTPRADRTTSAPTPSPTKVVRSTKKAAPATKKPPPKVGKVTVRVTPAAEVLFGGKSYGVTPIPPVEVPAGTATFTLRNKKLKVTRKVSVKVPPGGSVVLKADLLK
jgi:hypothetical protein